MIDWPKSLVGCFGALLLLASCDSESPGQSSVVPPPDRPVVISGIEIDGSSLNRFANETDIWPITWGPDGNLYAAGGDGLGWDGEDTRGLDVNRLTMSHPTDDLPTNGLELFSKAGVLPKGLISVDGSLYLLEQERGNGFARARVGRSDDLGHTWRYNGDGETTWDITAMAFAQGHFINFGRDNEDARDDFVYVVGMERAGGGGGSPFDQLVLARVPNSMVQNIEEWQYFTGTAEEPAWTSDIDDREPFFTRRGEIHWGATINYNSVLDRYLLTFFTNDSGTLAAYEAPEPWGPWTLIHENRLIDSQEKYSLFFVSKPGWISEDGLRWWFVTSGMNQWDSFNFLEARLEAN